jgi:hypothetical protein
MHSQRRRIQQMRMQKMREEVAGKERDQHFNTIGSVIQTKKEWRVQEKVNIPTPTTSNDNMDLLDDDAPLIKDGSLPPIGMDINMVFTLPTECLGPKEAMFEKPEESSQQLKSLYV